MKPDKHYNRILSTCSITNTPCDNPLGCIHCYHEHMEDNRAYYAGEGPLPKDAHQKRLKKYAGR